LGQRMKLDLRSGSGVGLHISGCIISIVCSAKRELLDTVKARKLAYYGHTMRKQGSCLEKR